jgi:uncharacterized protein (TIGR03032 family)
MNLEGIAKPDTTPDSEADALPPLRSVHTESFPLLLAELQASIALTTYQAGKLVFLRPQDGKLNTHFREFEAPMGLAANNQILSIGTPGQISHFRNMPAVARKREPIGQVDACYMPRDSHTTGDILVHEMAYGEKDELWVVNTRFSCLCTIDAVNSFVPRWKPPFITGYSPNDRCHLNGLGMVDGKPKYVTALGETNTPTGWRANKKDGGILIDVPSGEIIARNLSMPHSPRWHNGKLWVLESGKGSLSIVDLQTGKYEAVATFPGFTRGLDFVGRFAFVGLSQVRETAVFSGIPITDKHIERNSGVWVINIETGQIVAFVKFEDALHEVFSVQILQGIVSPDLVNDELELIHGSYELPSKAMKLVEISNPETEKEKRNTPCSLI